MLSNAHKIFWQTKPRAKEWYTRTLSKFQMLPFTNPAVFFCNSCLLLRSCSFLIVIDYYTFVFLYKLLPNASPTLSFFYFPLVFTIIYLRSYFILLCRIRARYIFFLCICNYFYGHTVLCTLYKNKKKIIINSCVILVVDSIK